MWIFEILSRIPNGLLIDNEIAALLNIRQQF